MPEETLNFLLGLVPWIVYAPVLGLLINIMFGKRLGEKGVGAVASSGFRDGFSRRLILISTSSAFSPKDAGSRSPIGFTSASWRLTGPSAWIRFR